MFFATDRCIYYIRSHFTKNFSRVSESSWRIKSFGQYNGQGRGKPSIILQRGVRQPVISNSSLQDRPNPSDNRSSLEKGEEWNNEITKKAVTSF